MHRELDWKADCSVKPVKIILDSRVSNYESFKVNIQCARVEKHWLYALFTTD